jgi:hypothetical protein
MSCLFYSLKSLYTTEEYEPEQHNNKQQQQQQQQQGAFRLGVRFFF